jgi:hypothetical protein
LLERELAEREFHIHFHPERAQAHEIVNDLACVCGLSSKRPGLQHHLFGVKSDPFVRPES